MVENWMKELCEDLGYSMDLQVLSYLSFCDHSHDITSVMQTCTRKKKDIIFYSYLLKSSDLMGLEKAASHFNNFDVIVFEETHALNSQIMESLITSSDKTAKERKK